jgi:hypothetical protein
MVYLVPTIPTSLELDGFVVSLFLLFHLLHFLLLISSKSLLFMFGKSLTSLHQHHQYLPMLHLNQQRKARLPNLFKSKLNNDHVLVMTEPKDENLSVPSNLINNISCVIPVNYFIIITTIITSFIIIIYSCYQLSKQNKIALCLLLLS